MLISQYVIIDMKNKYYDYDSSITYQSSERPIWKFSISADNGYADIIDVKKKIQGM